MLTVPSTALTIATNTEFRAQNRQITHEEIGSIKSRAQQNFARMQKIDSSDNFEFVKRIEKSVVKAWLQISKYFSTGPQNRADHARDHLYTLFYAESALNNADTDLPTKAQKKEEFITAFKQLRELADECDKNKFELIYDEASKKFTAAIFLDEVENPVVKSESDEMEFDNAVLDETGDAVASAAEVDVAATKKTGNLLGAVKIPIYGNEITNTIWENIQTGFSDANKYEAMEILNRMCIRSGTEPKTNTDHEQFQDFARLAALAKTDSESQKLFKVTVADFGTSNKKVWLNIQVGGALIVKSAMSVSDAQSLVLNNVFIGQIENHAIQSKEIHAAGDLIQSVLVKGFNNDSKPRAAEIINTIRTRENPMIESLTAFKELERIADPDTRTRMKIAITSSEEQIKNGQIEINLSLDGLSLKKETCEVSQVAETLLGLDSAEVIDQFKKNPDAPGAKEAREQAALELDAQKKLTLENNAKLTTAEKSLLAKLLVTVYRNDGHLTAQGTGASRFESNKQIRRDIYNLHQQEIYQLFRPGDTVTNLQQAKIDRFNAEELEALSSLNVGDKSVHTKFQTIAYRTVGDMTEFSMMHPLFQMLTTNPRPLLGVEESDDVNRLGCSNIYLMMHQEFAKFNQNKVELIQPVLQKIYNDHNQSLQLAYGGATRNLILTDPDAQSPSQ